MPSKLDDPYYTPTLDNRHIHLCLMPGHSRYWLNSGAALWVCEACHPGVGEVTVKPVGELMGIKEAERMEAKAISLWQPWALLVAIEAKKYETRGWATPYRGPLVIHAAKRFTDEEKAICKTEPFYSCLVNAGYLTVKRLPFGAYICTVDLVDIIPTEKIRDSLSQQERAFGRYSDGRFAWKLENVRVLPEPIPARGYQSLWSLDIREIWQVVGATKEKGVNNAV